MGAAHRREALDLVDVGDGHDAGQDGHLDSRGPRPARELEVAPVAEEELGDEEVRPREDPPAPQVTLTNEGPSGRRARSDSNSEATPASFLGGKNSNEKTGSPRSAAKRNMSVILIGAGSPRPGLRSRPTLDAACGGACGASRPRRSPGTQPAPRSPPGPTRPSRERCKGSSSPPA